MSSYPLLFILLPTTLHSQGQRSLEEIYSLKFGMNRNEVAASVATMSDSTAIDVERTDYQILSVKSVNFNDGRNIIDQLRIFSGKERGVFAIEEEIFFKWDHQQPDNDNMEAHRTSLEEILNRLRDRYGPENLQEETEIGVRYRKTNFVSSSWKFANNRWIHVMYEPQDWELFPEMVKIVIVYRDADLDPRPNYLDRSPNFFNCANL